MEHPIKIRSYPHQLSSRVCAAATFLFVLLAVAFSVEAASAQTGYTGIFGGGPFYKNAANNITEIKNSGFTEAMVWSVEVSSTGDLNFNGEIPFDFRRRLRRRPDPS